MTTHILLLCAGNICRSPMAEGLMRQALPAHELFSAGLCARDGEPVDPLAVALMQELGIDIAHHRARRFSSWMMYEADLVLTMDRLQQRYLQQRFPAAAARVERLAEVEAFDIPDPYQRGQEAFRQSLRLIRQAVNRRLQLLLPDSACALH